jgi:hypothetical protein
MVAAGRRCRSAGDRKYPQDSGKKKIQPPILRQHSRFHGEEYTSALEKPKSSKALGEIRKSFIATLKGLRTRLATLFNIRELFQSSLSESAHRYPGRCPGPEFANAFGV